MFDDAADIEQAFFRQIGIAAACKHVLAIFPDRLVGVHARSVVANDWLGHEGCRLAILMGDHVGYVFIDLHLVSGFDQRVVFHAQFVLGRCHFVVMLFHRQAHGQHGCYHFRTQIGFAVNGRNREIAAFDAGAVAWIAAVEICTGIVRAFGRVDFVGHLLHIDRPFHIVEYEEFCLRAKIRRVTNADAFHIGQAFFGSGAGVTIIWLAG